VKVALRIVAWIAIAVAAAPVAITTDGNTAGPPTSNAAVAGVTTTSPNPASISETPTAGRNLLSNGDFGHGSGKSPDEWRPGGWKEEPSVTSYNWLHSSGSEPELIVNNLQANDARWLQTLSLGPGWYYIGADVRIEDVPSNAAGASVSLDEDGINSPDLHGIGDWQRLGFYLKVGSHGADIDVALRLGGFSSLNTGRAFFRKASAVKIDALPRGASLVFDLSAIRRTLATPPVGKPWTLPAAFVLLAILGIVGWNIYGAAELAPAKSQPPPPSLPRAERRRRKDDARSRR
jgi:hypothetical protein